MTRTKKVFLALMLIILSTLIFAACQTSRSYEMTLDPNEGHFPSSEGDKAIVLTVLEGVPLPNVEKPVRRGYSFTGFYDTKNLIKQYYDANMNPVRLWDKTDKATLYAGWVVNVYTITFNPNKEGAIIGTENARVAAFATMPAAEAPTLEGFTFAGYFDQPEGKGVCYYDMYMKSANRWEKLKDAVLYAHWLPQYVVNLDFDGGYGSSNSKMVTVTYNLPMPTQKLYAPKKSLYMFMGYFAEKGGVGTKYYDEEMKSAHDWNREMEYDGNGDPIPFVIYAYWIPSAWNSLPIGSQRYSIENIHQLSSLTKSAISQDFEGYTFIINSDISGIGMQWMPIGAALDFAGTIDGNGHSLSFFMIEGPYPYAGFVSTLSKKGTIKNLTLQSMDIILSTRYQTTDSEGEKKSIANVYAGGLVGMNNGTIYNCHARVGISSGGGIRNVTNLNVGGLVGANSGRIEKSSVNTNMRLTSTVLEDDKAGITLDKSAAYVGSLVGRNFFESATGSIENLISECYSEGLIDVSCSGDEKNSTTVYVGGLVGSNDRGASTSNYSTIQDCYSTARITALATSSNSTVYAGGLAGLNDTNCTIYRTYASGNVTTVSMFDGQGKSYTYLGGLVGLNKSIIMYSFARGSLIANNNNAECTEFNLGAVVGRNQNAAVNNCYYYDKQQIQQGGVVITLENTPGISMSAAELSEESFYRSITWINDTYDDKWDCTKLDVAISILPKLVMRLDS